MVQPWEVSEVRGEFCRLNCAWPVRFAAGAQEFYLSGNYMADVFPLAPNQKGWVFCYAPDDGFVPTVPITRIGRDRYANAGGAYVMQAARTPLPGMVPFSTLLPQMVGGGRQPNQGSLSLPQIDGWVWPAGLGLDNIYDQETLVVSRSGQTETVGVSRKAGGMLCYWRSTGATYDVEWLLHGDDFGLEIMTSEAWVEITSAGTLRHNPTQYGCYTVNREDPTSPPYTDDGIDICAPTIEFRRAAADADIEVFSANVPLEFEVIPTAVPNQDHGGTDFHPVIYPRWAQWTYPSINWRGRVGVHRFRHAGRTAQFRATTTLAAAQFVVPQFDNIEFYDPVTNVATAMAWNAGVEGSAQYDVTRNATGNRTTGAGTTTFANPVASGYAAVILKGTGLNFGSAHNLVVGIACRMASEGRNAGGDIGRILVQCNSHPVNGDGIIPNLFRAVPYNLRPAGVLAFQYFVVTGTYAEVLTRIRQLYLDGLLTSVWNGPE